jgi:type IV pilus assembly protein PilM
MAYQSIGLDIGTTAVRAVELAVDGKRPRAIVNFGQVGLQPGTMVSGEIRDRTGLAEALRRLWREGRFSHRRVRVGIAGLRAIVRDIDMPLLPPDELESAVRFKADQVLPFPFDETVLSSQVVAQVAGADGPPTLRVQVAAAHAEVIEALVDVLERAGLEPVSIDLQTAALARALTTGQPAPEAVVSIGATLTLIVIHQDGKLQFVRTLDKGGQTVTSAIAAALDIPLRDAEVAKRSLTAQRPHDSMTAAACARAVSALVDEINNSIRFFGSLAGRHPVNRVLITGGGARTAGLLEAIGRAAGVPVVLASPLSTLDASGLQLTPQQAADVDMVAAVPVGLALHDPSPSERSFNLLPESVRIRVIQKRVHRVLTRAAIGVGVLIVGLSAMRFLQVHSAQDHLQAIDAVNTTIKNVEIPKYDKALALRNQVERQSALVMPILKKEVDWLVVLNQIAQYIPPNATLQNITMTAASIPGQGTTSTNGQALGTQVLGIANAQVVTQTLNDVTTWGQALSQSPIFELPDLSSTVSNSSQGGGVSFSTTLDILNGAASHRIPEFEVPRS